VKRILFVDDDLLVARLYSQKLVAAGFDVVMAEDGLVAMRRLVEFKPDLVLLDLLMPRMTGADVLKFIRSRPELKSTRVVVFSNSFLSKLVDQVASAGVQGTLVKSGITPAELIRTVEEVLAGPEQGAGLAPAAQTTPSVEPPAKAPAPAPQADKPEPAQPDDSEEKFRARLQKEFVERMPLILESVRQLCRDFLQPADPAAQRRRLEHLSRKIGFFTQMVSQARHPQLALLASALEALLFQLQEKSIPITDSCLHTIASTIAFLAERLERPELTEPPDSWVPSVLVVDDDAVSNTAVVRALGRARLRATSSADPFEALKKLEQNPYDLLLLDVQMPGMDGIALCEHARRLPLHKRTPAIFLTSHTDATTRARSALSGGDDFISKPIMPMELVVKVITHVLKGRGALAPGGAPPPKSKVSNRL
jgi:CheY-like chemotaxis protein